MFDVMLKRVASKSSGGNLCRKVAPIMSKCMEIRDSAVMYLRFGTTVKPV